MKFICTIPCVEAFHQVKELCDGVVMTNSHLSARYDSSFTNEEILQIVKKCNTHKMESFILIDNILFDNLTAEAQASPRLRMNLDLRNSVADSSQRMLNAIEPG